MSRLTLLLGALVLALALAPIPAHANGGGSTDVAPTAVAHCDPGDCWVRVREFDVANRGHTWVKEYHTGLGFWQTFAENVPFTIAGNESESFYRWAVDSVGLLECYPGSFSGTWFPVSSTVLDVDAKRATPGTITKSGNFATVFLKSGTPGDSVNLLTGGTPSVCTPSQMGAIDTGGLSNWSGSVAYMSDGIHVWVTGIALSDLWQWTSSSGWNSLGGGSAGSPSVVSWDQNNRLDVFIRGLDNKLWHRAWNGSSWQDWESPAPLQGGVLASGPGCASWAPNRLDCFVVGQDGASLWHTGWDGSNWLAWENLN